MDKLKYLAQRATEPSSWLAVSFILGLLGLPAPLVALLHQLLNLAPNVIDALAAIGAAGVAVALPEVARPDSSMPDFPTGE